MFLLELSMAWMILVCISSPKAKRNSAFCRNHSFMLYVVCCMSNLTLLYLYFTFNLRREHHYNTCRRLVCKKMVLGY